MQILVTRPAPDSSETAGRLRALNLDPVLCPLLRIEPLAPRLPGPAGFAAIALTSANAVRVVPAERLAPFLALPLVAVGGHTAAAARAAGFTDIREARGSYTGLVEHLAHHTAPGPVLYLAGRERTGDLARSLAPHGRMVVTCETYAMLPADPAEAALVALADGRIEAVLHYSRRSAERFVEALAPSVPAGRRRSLGMLCISEAVAAPLIDAHFVRIGLADQPSEDAMLALALSFAREQNAQ
jgi:uroporphyrinogen-III synthase